jgi:hypothetical protein
MPNIAALENRIVAVAAIRRGILACRQVELVRTALRDGDGSHFRIKTCANRTIHRRK